MKSYAALIRINLKLALRERSVLFFNYIFPLIFFFGFAQAAGGWGSEMTRVVTMVLVFGILGSGLFGAGIRAVAEREANILRRYKVAPISPAPILTASLVTGWILFLPSVIVIVALSHWVYGMPWPKQWASLFLIVSLGAVALRAVGLIVASVVNSVAESNIVIQLLYMPMLFLSGATFPIAGLPNWAQVASQFLPASHVYQGMQAIMLRGETILQNVVPAGALVLSTLTGLFIAIKIFRWEKDEKIPRSSKAWILAVLLPFLAIGSWQAYTKENIARSKMFERDLRRNRIYLIRGARIFTGSGAIETGGVLIQGGRIAKVYEGAMPEPADLKAESIDGYGKTLLPGFIDTHVHLAAPGGAPGNVGDIDLRRQFDRELAAYLYSGVTAVRSAGDPLAESLSARERIASGERLGAELFVSGPIFTAPKGHGTEYFNGLPPTLRDRILAETVRTPASVQEAARQVDELHASGVQSIKAVLESGTAGMLFERMDPAVFRAIVEAAGKHGLKVAAHTSTAADVNEAAMAGAAAVEHGVVHGAIPAGTLSAMRERGVFYSPTLAVFEAQREFAAGASGLLDRSLAAQVGPNALIRSTKAKLRSGDWDSRRMRARELAPQEGVPESNLTQAWKAGIPLAAGADSGNLLLIHGPAIHRELQLWVKAGITPHAALAAATVNAARLVGAGQRMGQIREGYEANLILVDGNPLEDISVTERISAVFFKGERINRQGLFDQK